MLVIIIIRKLNWNGRPTDISPRCCCLTIFCYNNVNRPANMVMILMPVQNSVFISYRRSPSKWLARLMFHDLTAHGYDVFLDVENLGPGRFGEAILRQIEARAHFILLIERGTLERCVDPEDWLRREIEHALDTQRNVIPVTVERYLFAEDAAYLTGKLAQLPDYQALPLDYLFFDPAMERLRTVFLQQPFHGALAPTPTPEQPIIAQQSDAAQISFQPTGYQASVTVPALNVRFGPGMNFPQVNVIRQGTQADILGRNADSTWWHVKAGDKHGWVIGHFVDLPSNIEVAQVPVDD